MNRLPSGIQKVRVLQLLRIYKRKKSRVRSSIRQKKTKPLILRAVYFLRPIREAKKFPHLIWHHFTQKKVTLVRWQLDLFGIVLIVIGFSLGSFISWNTVIPSIFAATSPWTQTSWSGGAASGNVTGTVTTYASATSIDTSTAGQISLSYGEEEFSDIGVDEDADLDNWLGVDPASISGLQVHVKADAGVFTDSGSTAATSGQDVQQWNDQSGQENNLAAPSSSRRPTLNDDQINGRPALSFGPDVDTANNSDAMDVALTDLSTLSVETIFTVGSFDHENQPASNYDYLYSIYNSATPTVLQGAIARQASNAGNPDKYYAIFGGSVYLGPVITSGFKLFTQQVTNSAPRHFLWMDRASQSVATLNSLTSIPNPKITLGKYQNNTWALNGRIAEFLHFNEVLDSDDVHAVENYLNNKYNLGTTTLTVDTETKRTGDGSMKVVAGDNTAELLQNVNVGDTDTYLLSAYVYTDGSEVTNSDAELYYNGSTVSTTFTSAGSGWYRMTGTITGADEARAIGVQVKADKTVYIDDLSLKKVNTTGVLTSNILNAEFPAEWGEVTYTNGGTGTVSVKVRSDSSNDMSGATDWASCSGISSGTDLSSTDCVTDGDQYVQYQVTLTPSGGLSPTFSDISIAFTAADQTSPITNASNLQMFTENGGRDIPESGWNNAVEPYFTWTAGADEEDGSGLRGYCVYLGTDEEGNPATSGGLLQNSPVSTSGTNCGFIISGTSLDLSAGSYLSSQLVSGTTYYLNIKAVDLAGNTFGGEAISFEFDHDSTSPTNVSYISMPSGSFSNVTDMSFSWPDSGGSASSDAHAGVVGWQYQINSTAGEWQGTTPHATLDLDYIPASASAYTLTASRDGADITTGNNVIYFRTVDSAGNTSASSTYRTGNLSYGGDAPSFDGDATVTITPSSAEENEYALSWPEANAAEDATIANYYYMINTSPPSTLATLEGNSSTYISNGSSRTVSADALPNVNKGSNTVYVVAVDDDDNYSPSNYISGTFTLNSTDPDNVDNLSASDSSIKASEQWNATLTWTAPEYQGAGNLTYQIHRSTDGETFSQVGTTTGLSYVDNTPSSTQYYYKVFAQDGAESLSSGTNAVTITPTGRWTTPPSINSGPTVTGITTSKATITWGTSRTADSRVQYGTSSGSYGDVEPSSSSQVTSHSLQLTGLTPGTTYYYKAKWTDEDGNIGTSDEKSFTTSPAPAVTDPQATSIGLTSAILQYTVSGASSVKIYYGTTTAFGGSTTISTSTSETTYTTELTDLLDGTKYFYKINTFDSDGVEYEGNTLTFETLPRPEISGVRIQQVANTAQSTILVTWNTNTEVSSIVTYYPEGDAGAARDEVNVALTEGAHRMIIRGLLPQTNYNLIVKGRDAAGNEAISDVQRLTTATDTRPPQVTGLKIEGTSAPSSTDSNNTQSQLVASWNTDEPATSQIEFGEGTGATYSQKTQEDTTLKTNHSVVISGLSPSKVYHLRVASRDSVGNVGNSIDTVTITPKATDNAFNLVITSLGQIFGVLGR